jgi:hypothetical protein
MLQQHGCGKGIDISLAMTRRPAHLANGAQCSRRCESLIQQRDRQSGSSLQFRSYLPNLHCTLRVVSVFIEGQTENEAACFESGRAPNQLRDRRPLAGPSQDEPRR